MAEDVEVVETPEIEGLDEMVLDIFILYLRPELWIQQVNVACSLPHSLEKPHCPPSSSQSLLAALGGHVRHK